MTEPRFLIVIGTSEVGLAALTTLLNQLPPDLDAAICVVMHLPRTAGATALLNNLQKRTPFTCRFAEEGMKPRRGHVYIPPVDFHLIVQEGALKLGRGTEENGWRPSIDVLFRSAAVEYTSRAIGVILSGLFDDGTAGMRSIHRCGGICLVQDPEEAEFPDLPQTILTLQPETNALTLPDLAISIQNLLTTSPKPREVPDDIRHEAAIAGQVLVGMKYVEPLGEQTKFTCPDCGGVVWEVTQPGEQPSRFRCYTGHTFSTNQMVNKQVIKMEAALWSALRIIEERRSFLERMQHDAVKDGFTMLEESFQAKTAELDRQIDKIKEVLFAGQDIDGLERK